MGEYAYQTVGATWAGDAAVYARVFAALAGVPRGARVLDAGCGNGYLASQIAELGYACVGVDASPSGIEVARNAYPAATFYCLDLTTETGALAPASFDVVTCVEVVEHVYAPRQLAANLCRLLKPGGRLILTTPYNGTLKTVAVALSGRFDRHFDPLWDHGHIKFFSPRTLRALLAEAGFNGVRVGGIGRVPGLRKSMVVTATRGTPDILS